MSTVGKSVAAWYRRINNYIRHIGLVLRSAVWYTAEKQRHIGEKCVWGDACREQNGNICFHSGSSLKTSSRVTIVISLHSLFMLQLLRGACLDFKALRYLLNFFFFFIRGILSAAFRFTFGFLNFWYSSDDGKRGSFTRSSERYAFPQTGKYLPNYSINHWGQVFCTFCMLPLCDPPLVVFRLVMYLHWG